MIFVGVVIVPGLSSSVEIKVSMTNRADHYLSVSLVGVHVLSIRTRWMESLDSAQLADGLAAPELAPTSVPNPPCFAPQVASWSCDRRNCPGQADSTIRAWAISRRRAGSRWLGESEITAIVSPSSVMNSTS